MLRIFKQIKKIVPRISDTELTALRSGTVSVDGDIFRGFIPGSVIGTQPISKDIPHQYNRKGMHTIMKTLSNCQVYPNDKTDDILNALSHEKMFSFIISKKYGGTELLTSEMSSVLTEITSANPGLGVTVMVPNSLGPGELLQHYGTNQQKTEYLPKLANGEYIPCFGLTGPYNGSDALGSIDRGVVKEENGERFIEVSINKRYITLAPVANLVGLAIHVDDPNHLLKVGKDGITVALLKAGHDGLHQLTHHNPNNVGFPNGTLKGTIRIGLNDVIGGETQVGNGWKMLMECLAAGRGVCLPATAQASSKTITYGIYNYIKHRKQFQIPLLKMEGVNNLFCDMLYQTWTIQASIAFTNHLLDLGEKPAVISAIMKQQTTERGRIVLNHGMDIYAGSAICHGENNFIEKFYRSAPIGITVEGSNTLTRNLIIFGQGLNKSHPHIYSVYKSVIDDDIDAFKKHFSNIAKHSLVQYGKNITCLMKNDMDRQIVQFANMSNFVALMGGALKKNQSISGDMADILGNLYMCISLQWYHTHFHTSDILTEYCIRRILDDNIVLMNRVIHNYPHALRLVLLPFKQREFSFDYDKNRNLLEECKNNPKIINKIREDVWTDCSPFKEFEELEKYESDTKEYREIYDKIIQVGEYRNV